MIAFIRGVLQASEPDQAVIDVNGVGYRVFASPTTLRALPQLGREVCLHTVMHVREDAILLYGFANNEEKEVFCKLINVTGVGPRLALATLGVLTPANLARAVAARDVKALTQVPGIGKKTAERLLLELRDKLPSYESEGLETGSVHLPTNGPAADAIAGLVTLGYSQAVATTAVEAILAANEGEPHDAGQLLRAALCRING